MDLFRRSKKVSELIREKREIELNSLREKIKREIEKDALQELFGQGFFNVPGWQDEDFFLQLVGGRRRLFPGESGGSEDFVKKYEILIWVYIAVKRISSTIAGVPLRVVDPDTKQPVEDHPLQLLLDRPTEDMSGGDLIERTFIYLETDGKVLYKLVRDKRTGVPVEIKVPESYNIRPKVVDDHLIGFEQYVGADERGTKWEQIDLEDAVYIRYFHPTRKWEGLSPLSAARLELDTDMAANMWNRAFFYNSAIPGGVLETDKRVTPEEAERLRASWEEKFRGIGRWHRVAILPLGLKFREISLKHSDMEFLEQQRNIRSKIFAIYGVPLPVAGFYESDHSSGRSVGVQQYMRSFWTLTLIPKMKKHVTALNSTLGQEFGVEFAYDLSSVEALQENQLEQAQTARMMLGTGVSINEIRERVYGLPPIPGGDVVLVPQALLPVGEVPNEESFEEEYEGWISQSEDVIEGALRTLEQNSMMLSGGKESGEKLSGKKLLLSDGVITTSST